MSRLLAPFARISLGDRDFYWSDGRLKSVSVTSAEGNAASSCTFSLYDPGRKLIDALLIYIEEIQGLEPLEKPQAEKSTGAAGGGGIASGDISVNMRAMLHTIAHAEGTAGPDGYRTQFTGTTFQSFADHPREIRCSNGLCSDAAGKYQFLSTTWDGLGLPDFTPPNQDKGAIALIESRGATAAVEAGDVAGAFERLSYEWASLPPYRYDGQGTKSLAHLTEYFEARKAEYAPTAQSQTAAVESVAEAADPPKEKPLRTKALAGSQITVGLGFDGEIIAEWSFLHTSLGYSLYDHDVVEIGGSAASWLMTQRTKNTAYINLTLKQLARKICSAYGLELDMEEDGPKYEYFPQRGVSDYQALLIECRRIGYRMTTYGRTLTIKPRGPVEAFALVRGQNLGKNFSISHSAQGQSSGGARSSDPSHRTTTGQKKTIMDPDTGRMKTIKPENLVGTGDTPTEFTTGSAVSIAKPRTDGATDEADSVRQSNEARVKGIESAWSAPTTPEILLVTPDSAIQTEGISGQIDRVWVVESITHSLGADGFSSSGKCYSPLKNKYPAPPPRGLSTRNSKNAGSNPGGFIKPINGLLTSGYGPRGSRLHAGVDLAAPVGTPVWASADGVASIMPPNPAGYGNWIIVTHPDNTRTRYGHLSEFSVEDGATVQQGDVIALSGNTGASTGPHLHFEIRPNDQPVNPAQFVDF